MTCRTCGSPASDLVYCIGARFGIVTTKWNEELHNAFYRYLSTIVNVQAERGMSPEQIAAIPFGAEPATTASYVTKALRSYWQPGDTFWGCLWTGRDEILASDVVTAAAKHVREAEGRSPNRKTGEGVPTWLVLTGVGIGIGVLIAVLKE